MLVMDVLVRVFLEFGFIGRKFVKFKVLVLSFGILVNYIIFLRFKEGIL